MAVYCRHGWAFQRVVYKANYFSSEYKVLELLVSFNHLTEVLCLLHEGT